MSPANSPLAAGHPQVNATVMASAGTGKTWLLVTRLVRLLLEGARPDAILAITFTRKAAAEMQTRLAERLLALATAPLDELTGQLQAMGVDADEATCTRARRLYEQLLSARQPVRTTTFHAFCQSMLRRFPLEADVPPGFELVERTGDLEGAARDALEAEATREPNGALASDLSLLLAYCGSLDGLYSALDSFLAHRSDWWALIADQPDGLRWATEALRQRLGLGETDEAPDADFLETSKDELADFAELLCRHPTQTNLGHADCIAVARSPESPTGERFAAACEALLTTKGVPRQRKASKAQAAKMTPDGEAQFLALHQTLCERLLAARDRIARQQTLAATGAWYRVGERLLTHFQRIKEEQRLLDFADLEWRAYRLLNRADNAHWVQFKLDQRIDHLLVDEFQDTNPTQWQLLLPLLEEMAAGAQDRQRSVFLVGDVKQSIYRFRRAEPRLLPAAHEWLAATLDGRAHQLDVSWRSAPVIMDLVNRLFGDGPLAERLEAFTPHATHHTERWGRVELLPLSDAVETPAAPANAELRNPLQAPREVAVDDRYFREGQRIAERIRALVDEQTPVFESNGKVRPATFGDIMLLVRSRTHTSDYERALREAGLPYVGADRGTLLDALEVRDLVALLEILITPYNHLSLAQVLRSPLFACDETALMQLAGERGPWLPRLHRLAEACPADAPLARASRLLGQWRALTDRLPIHDLLDRIYADGDVLARYEAAFPDYLRPRVRANLIRLVELALEIDAGRYPSLSRFLARLAQLRESTREAPDEAPSGSGDRVRILTIHASKGLEAPVVVLADAAGIPAADRPYRAQVEWPAGDERPRGLFLVGRQLQQDGFTRTCLEAEAAADTREQANLLYVALTRSRQLLLISGSAPRRGEALGWYGNLLQALGSEEPPVDAPLVLESGNRPAVSSPISPIAAPPELPPALLAPLEAPALPLEIAPSRRVEHPGGGAATSEEDARLRGVVIHRLLERLTQEADHEACRQAVAAEYALPPDDPEYQAWWHEAKAVFDAPRLAAVFHPEPGRRAWCEVPLCYRDPADTVVHGIIDRLVVGTDDVWIIDYKTHRLTTDAAMDQLAELYREQMRLYAEGVRRLYPHARVRASLLFTASQQLRDVPIENGALEPTLSKDPGDRIASPTV